MILRAQSLVTMELLAVAGLSSKKHELLRLYKQEIMLAVGFVPYTTINSMSTMN